MWRHLQVATAMVREHGPGVPGNRSHRNCSCLARGTKSPRNSECSSKVVGLNDCIVRTVSEVSSAPAASIGRWAADQVAPAYWRPNADIINCHNCNKRFDGTDKIHHCRACGEGFCSTCSNYQRPVPDRGWGYAAVRVCKPCYNMTADERIEGVGVVSNSEPNEVQVRKVGETVYGTVSSLATAFEFPINIIKDSARPDYWVPDSEITKCSVCDKDIGNNMSTSQSSSNSQDMCTRVHHCRQCGQGVCNACSSTRRPVPHRGWDTPVRVCDDCLLMP